jgi:hypothetical protein
MDKLFFVSIAVVGIISALLGFLPEQKLNGLMKGALFAIIVICLIFQGWYGWIEKRTTDYKDFKDAMYQDETLRGQTIISKDIKELKEKEKKGLLTDNDYSLYIARYLESIDHTLKYSHGKNTREWVTTYYEQVKKIPEYFTFEEWKESEKFIYDSMVNEINGHFAARGTFDSGMRPKLLERFKKERERLLQAKEREFNR